MMKDIIDSLKVGLMAGLGFVIYTLLMCIVKYLTSR